MIYLVGGSPRAGKSLLGQQIAANLKIGWVSTDQLVDILRVNDKSIPNKWDATPEAIAANAEWFFPYLERFVWGIDTQAESYVIEGVAFLPAQVKRLAAKYQLRALFLGCSQITLQKLDQFPGRSVGYSFLPEEFRLQIARDVPLWSGFIQHECQKFEYPYIDTGSDFASCLTQAESILTTSL